MLDEQVRCLEPGRPQAPGSRADRGRGPAELEQPATAIAGVVFDTGQFSLTADYFRINVSDRIGITSNFTLTAEEIDTLLAADVEAARDLRRFRFFTNAFSTASQGIDLVSTFTPLALRGNTTISAVFNYTDTEVTDNRKGLLNDRRLAEFAYALPRTRWNIGLTQQVGRVSVLGRVNYFGGWYDYDSGFAQLYVPSSGIEQGFLDGRPIVDLEASIALEGRGRSHRAKRRRQPRAGRSGNTTSGSRPCTRRIVPWRPSRCREQSRRRPAA